MGRHGSSVARVILLLLLGRRLIGHERSSPHLRGQPLIPILLEHFLDLVEVAAGNPGLPDVTPCYRWSTLALTMPQVFVRLRTNRATNRDHTARAPFRTETSDLSNPVITLTTDYGTSDHLVGVLKGVILRILPTATVVDINHHVVPFDVLDGALTIGSAYRYFPPHTVHVVVVDPGVGTQRRPILASSEQQYFVAPDNGVLSMIYERAPSFTVRHITAEHYFQSLVSNTFHGRDIFAPAAAWLAKTHQTEAFGDVITDYARFTLPRVKADGAALKGVVLRVDSFGNLMTNFAAEDLSQETLANGKIALQIGSKQVERLAQTFAQGPPGEPVAILGSSGFVEIAVNKGNAARLLGVNRGAEVTLKVGQQE